MRDPKILTTSDVARRLHVTPSTVFRWIKAGWLKSWPTAGHHNRIREEDLLRFMRERGMRTHHEDSPMRVVIADGQAATVDQVARIVGSAAGKCQVETATDGYQALIKVGSFSPHLVILDAEIPNMQIEDACRAIRSTRPTRHAKILAISGADEQGQQTLLDAGADAVVSSPVSPQQLLDALRRLSAAPASMASIPPHAKEMIAAER